MTALPKVVADYLAEIGRKGGQIGGLSKSKKKTDAVKKNGKKGGRPKNANSARQTVRHKPPSVPFCLAWR